MFHNNPQRKNDQPRRTRNDDTSGAGYEMSGRVLIDFLKCHVTEPDENPELRCGEAAPGDKTVRNDR